MDETEYLLSSPANAKRLLAAIESSKKDEERVSLDEVIKGLKKRKFSSFYKILLRLKKMVN